MVTRRLLMLLLLWLAILPATAIRAPIENLPPAPTYYDERAYIVVVVCTSESAYRRFGFVVSGYRYYNPDTGRWLSRDPVQESGGLNLYGFVYNDPNTYFDGLGDTPGSGWGATSWGKFSMANGLNPFTGTPMGETSITAEDVKEFAVYLIPDPVGSYKEADKAWSEAANPNLDGLTRIGGALRATGTTIIGVVELVPLARCVTGPLRGLTRNLSRQRYFVAVGPTGKGDEFLDAAKNLQMGKPQPLTQKNLDIGGNVRQVKASVTIKNGVAHVNWAGISGELENVMAIMTKLKAMARQAGANMIRIEAMVSSPKLRKVLEKRWNMQHHGGKDVIIIDLD